jgi:hypothetical protein
VGLLPVPDIEIFRAGRHTAMSGETLSFSDADLDGTVSSYDPAVHEAPVVIGHPKHDAPAYGWVKGLRRDGDSLLAGVDQLEPGFAEMVRDGRFKKVSASFYKPDSPSNPKPGSYYLRHVGFLGAQPPAVKGLAPIELSDDPEQAVTIEFGEISGYTVGDLFRAMRDWMLTKFGQEDADQALPAGLVTSLQEQAAQPEGAPSPAFSEPTDDKETKPVTDKPKQPAVDADELARREADLRSREAAFAEREREQRRAENASFLEGLVKEGRPLPCAQDTLLAFMDHLGGATVDFGESEQRDPLTVFKDEVLAKLPKQVDFGEKAPADGADDAVDTAEEITRRALVYQEEQRKSGIQVSVTEAVRHVTKEKS